MRIDKKRVIQLVRNLENDEISDDIVDEIANLDDDILQDMNEFTDLIYEEMLEFYHQKITHYYFRLLFKILSAKNAD